MRAACLAAVLSLFAVVAADAQFVYVAGYAPSPMVVAPAPVVAYRPVTRYVAASPVVVAPAAPMAIVAPAAVATPVVTTRYRPILGGTVSRVRYYYTPTVLAY